jgi:hypothetical protein
VVVAPAGALVLVAMTLTSEVLVDPSPVTDGEQEVRARRKTAASRRTPTIVRIGAW